MKFHTITLLGALASANAGVIRGNAAAKKKLAIMQKLTESFNKKSSGAIRRQLEENAENQNDNNMYEGFTEDSELTPGVCVTVTKTNAYDGIMTSTPYMTFSTGDGGNHAVSLATYLQEIGVSWVAEKEGMCEECQMYEGYCEMDENERAEMAEKFADMDEEAFTEYMQEEQQHQQQQQQQQNQKNKQNAATAYIAYKTSGYGRRNLYAGFVNPDYVCETCEQSCEDGHMNEDEEEYYKELENMFENGVCIQLGEYQYIGPTCGADGRTIEMGVFSDQYCTSMVKDSAYGYMGNVYMGDQYMALLEDLFENPFSCSMGMQFDYRAAYENNENAEPSEACEGLAEYSISEYQCNYGNQYNQYNQYNNNNEAAEEGNQWANQNIAADCAEIFEQQAALINGKSMNFFTGQSYFDQNGLSSGAIAGIAIAFIVVIVAGVALALKSKKKSELEEPVFQGGSLS